MRSWLVTAIAVLAAFTVSALAPRGITVIRLHQDDPMRFVVVGDAGTGDPHLRNALKALSREEHIEGVLLVGDNVYPCGVTSLSDPEWSKVTNNFGSVPLTVYPVLGNHDYGDPIDRAGHYQICGHPDPGAEVGATGTVPHWDFPARNYVLHSPVADIVMIDTQPIASGFAEPFLGSKTAHEEVQWVGEALRSSKAAWKIALGHHTIYSSGEHGVANHRDQRHLRQELLPLLKAGGVDLYVCGHDHDAELLGSLQHRDGAPLFLVSGNGAESQPMTVRTAPDEPPTIFPPAFPPPPLVGFTLLEITPHELDVTFFDQAGAKRSPVYALRK